MTAHSQQEGKGKRHSVKWGKGAMCLDLFLLLPLSLLLLLMWLSALHFVYTQHHKDLDNRRIVLAKYSSLSWYPSLLITDQIFTTQVCFTTEPMRLTVFFPPLMRPSLFFPFFARPCLYNYSFSKIFHTFRSFLCEGCKRKPPCDFPASCRPDLKWRGTQIKGTAISRALQLAVSLILNGFSTGRGWVNGLWSHQESRKWHKHY